MNFSHPNAKPLITSKRHPGVLQLLAILLLGAAIYSGTQATWLSGKAWLAQQLMLRAWQDSQLRGVATKPWRWADVSTVARLSIEALDIDLIVLSDASGEAMAFGPGLVAGDPRAARTNTIAIGGHRDTHLAFLEDLQPGEIMDLQSIDGETHRYQLLDKQVLDTRIQSLQIASDSAGLVLITCYPFNASQTGGPLRLVARARPLALNPLAASSYTVN